MLNYLLRVFPQLLCGTGFILCLNQLIDCTICRRIEILTLPLEAWGAGIFFISAVLFSLGCVRQLQIFLTLICITHVCLFLSYNPNCPTCYVIFLLEVILLLLSFRTCMNRNIQTTASVALVFLCIGIFFSFKASVFTFNPQVIQKQQKQPEVVEAAIPRAQDQKMQNEIWVQNEHGQEVKVTGPVLFFAWW